jgi:hypothetical protein
MVTRERNHGRIDMAVAKLVRGIGLLMVLAAWFLEWGLVQPFEQLASTTSTVTARHRAVLEQIEIERRATDTVFAATGPEDDFVDLRLRAWNSPFYRSRWFQSTVSFLSIVAAAYSDGHKIEQDHGHPPSGTGEEIAKIVRNIQQKMLKGVDEETKRLLVAQTMLHIAGAKPTYTVLTVAPELPFVDRNKLTVTDFTEINRLLQQLRLLTLRYSSSINGMVVSAATQRSNGHRYIFGVGSFFIVVGTLLEAAAERRRAKAVGAPLVSTTPG